MGGNFTRSIPVTSRVIIANNVRLKLNMADEQGAWFEFDNFVQGKMGDFEIDLLHNASDFVKLHL